MLMDGAGHGIITFIRKLAEKSAGLGGWVGEGKGEEFGTKVPAVEMLKGVGREADF